MNHQTTITLGPSRTTYFAECDSCDWGTFADRAFKVRQLAETHTAQATEPQTSITSTEFYAGETL